MTSRAYIEYGAYRIQLDWTMHAKQPYAFRKVRKSGNGRWNGYGELRRIVKPYRIEYWTERHFDEVDYEHNGWALDHSALKMLKSFAVTHIGVVVKETKEEYLLPYMAFDFIDIAHHADAVTAAEAKGIRFIDCSKRIGRHGRLGARQWVVPLTMWEHEETPPEPLMDAILIKTRRVSTRRTKAGILTS